MTLMRPNLMKTVSYKTWKSDESKIEIVNPLKKIEKNKIKNKK